MTPEEKQAHDALIVELKSVIATENSKSNETIVELKNKIAELEAKSTSVKAEDFEAVKAEAIKLAGEFKAFKENAIEAKSISKDFRSSLEKAFEEKATEIKSIVENGGKQLHSLNIEVKAAVDMTNANTIGAGATQYTLTQNTGIVGVIRKRVQKYLANVSVGAITAPRALWVEETDEQGAPIFIGEGVGKTQLSVLYVEKTANVKKIAVYGKVTTEMLADLPQLISYIENNLMKRLEIKIEDQLLVGDNIGENLNGAKTVATAFSAGALANLVPFANEWDVLNAIATQVEVANGIPNAAFVHPSTLQAMRAVKSSTGEPLWKYYQDVDGNLTVAGMKLISTTGVTAGEFIAGDLSIMNVLFREQTNIQIGLDGNDFINNKKTILVESRLVQFANANDVATLVKGDFVTAKAALLLV